MGSNNSFKLRIALIARADLGHAANKVVEWGKFKKKLAEPLVDVNTTLVKYHSLSKDQQRDLKDVGSYVLGHFDGGKRKRENIKLRSAVALDLDNPTNAQMEWLREGFSDVCKYEFFAVTTRSHILTKAKYRLIFPLKEQVPAELYFAVSRILTSMLFHTVQESMEATDDVSHRVAQVMFLSSKNKDGTFDYFENKGELLDYKSLIEDYGYDDDYTKLPFDENRRMVRPGQLGPAERPNEKEGPVGDFCRAYSVQDAIAKFLPDIYVRPEREGRDTRYTYAAGSGVKGVVVYDGGLFIYSHHGTDPCSERNTNAFDMVRLHKFGDLDKVDGDPESPGKMPSFKAMLAWAQTDPGYKREAQKSLNAKIDAALPDLGDDPDAPAPRPVAKPKAVIEPQLPDPLDDVLGLPETPPIEDDEDEGEEEIPEFVRRINQRHAFAMMGGKSVVIYEGKDNRIDYGTVDHLHNKYANLRIPNGKGGEEPISSAWIRSNKRREYLNGVTFDPDYEGTDTFNMWKGWSVEPKPGDCSLILKHIREVVCPASMRDADYLIGWLAHMVQRPGEKPGVAVAIKGKKGCGKDTLGLYMKRIMERNYRMFADSQALYGPHNRHLEQCLFCHLEEAIWVGAKKHESILKSLITAPTLHINPKGIDAYDVKSIIRLFMSSNEQWVVPATTDERRYFVSNVSEKYRGNREYFAALYREMTGAGPAAFLDYLMKYDLSGFEVRDVPDTEALAEQKAMGHQNVALFWREILDEGELPGHDEPMQDDPGPDWRISPVTVHCNQFQAAYSAWMRHRRYDGAEKDKRQVGKDLKEMIQTLERKQIRDKSTGKRHWVYEFPSLPECRIAFDSLTGSVSNWESDDEIETQIGRNDADKFIDPLD